MEHGPATLFDLPAPVADEAIGVVPEPTPPTRAEELLAEIRDDQRVLAEREIAKVRHIAEWADEHIVGDEADASTLTEYSFDTGLPVAGPGAPLISDLAVMQLAAVLGRTLDSGRSYVGQVVELAHRLPLLWERVLDGQVAVWRALRVAGHTRPLPLEAAGFVDRQLALTAHGMTWAEVGRLVEEALVRFDPAAADQKRREANDRRRFDLDLDNVGFDGTVDVTGTLDVADALDLEAAVARRAQHLGALDCEESLDVRRSVAVGEIARQDLTLDLQIADPETGETTGSLPARHVELIVHLNAAVFDQTADGVVGRLGNTRTPISPELVREWIGGAGAKTIVRPVIDLAGHQPTDSYETPDRVRRQVVLRDHHCVYPHCTKPAERCDLDHVCSYGTGGPTCACNLAPLCRGHHRLKTAGLLTYHVLNPGTYLWTGTAGTWLVDPTGTHDLTEILAEPLAEHLADQLAHDPPDQ